MNSIKLIITAFALVILLCNGKTNFDEQESAKFNSETDLLLVQYDCKTDVDDLHSIAAFATLNSDSNFTNIDYHAVAGAYGIQDGPYVPPNELFELAFDENWTDAHTDFKAAVEKVKRIAINTLNGRGDIWIAEAGQSDFSADLVRAIQSDLPDINTPNRIHLIQHSDWNEEVTSVRDLSFVKQNTDYRKIPDGNATGNGTPGFRSPDEIDLKKYITDSKLLSIWQRSIKLANKYNGKEGRHLNEAIEAGGLDFSDFSEVCWIFNLDEIRNADQFFSFYSKGF